MKYPIITFFLISLGFSGCAQGNKKINGSMEQLDSNHTPADWNIKNSNLKNKGYVIALDSVFKVDGKYSLSISQKTNEQPFQSINFHLPSVFEGNEIELKGFLKLENVNTGWAGLWLKVDGSTGTLAFDNMQNQKLSGTADWKEYSIKLPYNSERAQTITLGALIAGKGKIWVDNLRLYIDSKPVDKAVLKVVKLPKAQMDNVFQISSMIDTIKINKQEIENLTILCEIWGFLKYHHPAIARGDYNMDAELFRILPFVIKSKNKAELTKNLENWLDKFGKPDLCVNCDPDTNYRVAQLPNYGMIFSDQSISPSLVEKLKYILHNRNHINLAEINNNELYYVKINPSSGNILFTNEFPYEQFNYPDVGYRLLCLFRYWNMIQYYYPNRHLIGSDWNEILPKYIPRFIAAANKTDYILTTLALIGEIHDTHANIWSVNPVLENYRGNRKLPITTQFIEGKLVVTGYYVDSLNVKDVLKLGDIITGIDGISINELIKKYLPLTPASNIPTQLRDMAPNFLLRSNKLKVNIQIISNGRRKSLNLETIDLRNPIDSSAIHKIQSASVLPGNIGFLYAGEFKNTDLPRIEDMFKGTKGIIVDLRCYPSDFMPFTFIPFVKKGNAPFAKSTYPNIYNPGLFKFANPIIDIGTGKYTGKVIVLVNEYTQSQAEYTTMAFQSSGNVTVIGSTTAGADGDFATIFLPGGIRTMISGLGILYPDGAETQRTGVKINFNIKPTIDGIKKGKDELLDKAIQLIENN